MSGVEKIMIDRLLTPEVMAAVDPVLAALGLEAAERERESFVDCLTWIQMFGSTAGPFHGIGGAAMTHFRLTVVHSPAAMILFANNERFGPARLYGVAKYDRLVLEGRGWEAFTAVPAF
ncbi:hypothetical protein GCM10023063_19010 [Arthrobacter methylotrophus]|uniref:DUF1801 domain-containing protein n=1 Tax=Arthrobacter methylotrophus TaxID=121291 RepID=A0ABV5URJ0_9MICC